MMIFSEFKTAAPRWSHSVISLFIVAATFTASLPVVSANGMTKGSTKVTEDQRILHVLNRLGFGARPGDLERVKAVGLDNYINQQLSPEKINDDAVHSKVKHLTTLEMTTAQLYEKFPQPGQLLRQLQRRGELPEGLAAARDNRRMPNEKNPAEQMAGQPNMEADQPNAEYRQALREYYRENGLGQPQRIVAELQASRILRAVYSERQLNEVMVDFWSNHFNVFFGKGADRWLLTSYDRDTIRPNAMGKFSELLTATAQSPAMLFYLDNFQSVSPNMNRPERRPGGMFDLRNNRRPSPRGTMNPEGGPRPAQSQRMRRGINENYARELMELHTLGVDGGYTQKDVQEVARCFTGWTIFAPRGGGAAASAILGEAARREAGRFFFNARAHDDGEKVVLGHKIPAGGGFKDGLMVLDILARHPSTAKSIANKLVRHFVSDNPPASLVDRVAATFTKSKGDIRETLRTIFFSPEFYSQDAYRAKVKRPFELTISAIRALGAETNGGPQLHQWIARMGEPLYGYQTPNGYSDNAESWVNTGGLLERMNFGLVLASNRIPGTRVDLKRFAIQMDGSDKVVDSIARAIIGEDLSATMKSTLLKQYKAETPLVVQSREPDDSAMEASAMRAGAGAGRRRQQMGGGEANVSDPVTKVVGLVLGSPEFQRQ
ncbi:MAG TPA: DUF1800 domain-containing protein [Pyrinomonadaceae bacterium]|nr:DUF1800 domain-containing protein [Pyrinomonadaceae bacterium]